MKAIYQALQHNVAVQQLIHQTKPIATTHEALLIESAFFANKQSMVIVKSNSYQAGLLYQQLHYTLGESCLLFSHDDSFRIELLAASPEVKYQRLDTLNQLLNEEPKIVVTHVSALVRMLPSVSFFKQSRLTIRVNQTIEMNALKTYLVDVGYRYQSMVDTPLTYSQRGGVVDIYSVGYDYPIRIEFFDTEIESIRFYDPETQRTMYSVNEVTLVPASDLIYDTTNVEATINWLMAQPLDDALNDYRQSIVVALQEHDMPLDIYPIYEQLGDVSTLMDYIKQPCLVVLSEPEQIKQTMRQYEMDYVSYQAELKLANRLLMNHALYDYEQIIKPYPKRILRAFADLKSITFDCRTVEPLFGKEPMIIEQFQKIKDHKVLLMLSSKKHMNAMKQLLEDHQMPYVLLDDDQTLYPGIQLIEQEIGSGFQLANEGIVVYSSHELFDVVKTKHRAIFSKFKEAKKIESFNELKIGDYVVHESHGIGQYLGIKTLENQGVKQDYLYLAYRGNDVLYIPVEQFKMVRKYMPKEGAHVKVHQLGGSEWQKTKRKMYAKINDLADRLIALYASRQETKGFSFSKDHEMQHEFEQLFDYPLTHDQQTSLDEIKQDMESSIPMDRLLCGDVGFGKTEVALRAAFKAIMDNKQVMFLCPTTILSFQHYQTALTRMGNFPINIAVLNRFASKKQQADILSRYKAGHIDLLIGTHRILSKDVVSHDLGLLIVDEEQRFGVRHKERIKELKVSVDVLTLTATPIPRTLQMSLMGIRGLSQINTPPNNRLPVQTYVMEKTNSVIKEVIERELSREGQVFYLYNHVEELSNRARKIQEMVPNARIGIGHGQMDKEDLEEVMLQFNQGLFDVLVCTTIVETGLDIPNANTMIIEDADHFGLSQLYQLRGRVGRSDRLGFAYLLYRPQKSISEVAYKRLQAIKEFTELGSGYRIAMRDLSIRGAGDILGPEQAGFIDTVGFDMYMKMLQDVLAQKRGEVVEDVPIMHLKMDAYLPNSYVSNDYEKLSFYQDIETTNTLHALEDIEHKIEDMYGKIPDEVRLIVEKRRFELLLKEPVIVQTRDQLNDFMIEFSEDFSNVVDGSELFESMNKLSKDIRLTYKNKRIGMIFKKSKEWVLVANKAIDFSLKSLKVKSRI